MPIKIALADAKQTALLQSSIDSLTTDEQTLLATLLQQHPITALVDGRGLACPMPLLKTKVALRGMPDGSCVYVLATDPNSQADLMAFCQQSALTIVLSTQTDNQVDNQIDNKAIDTLSPPLPEDRLIKLDTIFHVIITKTYGN